MKTITESEFLTALDSQNNIEDKGHIGLGMITPVKKPAHGEFTDIDRRNNMTINRVRHLIERVIANLRTGRVLHTDHRRPCGILGTTERAVAELILDHTP